MFTPRVLNRSATPCLGLEVFEVSNLRRCCTHGSTVFAPVVRGEDPDREAALRAASEHSANRGEDRPGQVHGVTRAEACLCSISCCGFSHDDFSGLGRACRPRNGLNWMVLVSPPERTGKDYDQHAPSTVYPSFAAERGIRRVDRAENTCRRSRRCVSTSRRRICRPCRR